MMTVRSGLAIATAMLLALSPVPALAQAGPQTTTAPAPQSMADLLGQGYEIKAVTLVPADVVQAGGATDGVPAVMILLQSGAVLANCYVTYSSYTDGSYFRSQSCYLRQ